MLQFDASGSRLSYGLPNMLHTVSITTEYLAKYDKELFYSCQEGNVSAVDEISATLKIFLQEHLGKTFFKDKGYNEEMEEVLCKEIFDEIFHHGPLTDLMKERDNKSDLHFNIYEITYRDKANNLVDSNLRFLNERHLEKHVNRLLDPIGETLTRTNKVVDAVLPDGTRVHAHHKICTSCGHDVRLRFHLEEIPTLDENITYGMLDEVMKRFIILCTIYGFNVHAYGPQGTGKTTFIGTYINAHPRDEFGKTIHNHILIADLPELFIKKRDPKVRILELHEYTKGESPFTVLDGVIASLRTDSDRIHFNEVRGAEFSYFLYASSKAGGGISGGHSNSMNAIYQSQLDAQKLADPNITDYMASRRLVNGLDVYLRFHKFNNRRVITEISLLVDHDGVKPIFEPLFSYDNINDRFIYHKNAMFPEKMTAKVVDTEKTLHELLDISKPLDELVGC